MKLRNKITFFFLWFCPLLVLSQNGFQFEQGKKKVTIPFQLINNLIFIPLELNGVALNFLLDSGVDQTILLSLDDKEEVSLHSVQKIKLRGLGSSEPVEALRSSRNRLSYKNWIDPDHELYIVLDQRFNFSAHIGIPVNGIIGYHFFKNHVVDINYDHRKLTIYPSDELPRKKWKKYATVPLTIEKNKPYLTGDVTISKNIIPSKLLVDLGNSDALWLFENPRSGFTIPPLRFEDYLGRGFSGDIFGYRTKIGGFALAGHQFTAPVVAFPDSLSIQSVNRVADRMGSVGGEILKRFRVVFDYTHGNMYLRKGRHFEDAFSYNLSGIELQNDGMQWVQETMSLQTTNIDNTFDNTGSKVNGNFRLKFMLKPVFSIAAIRKNAAAEACGLQCGDILVSINGEKAYHYTLQELNELMRSGDGKWIYLEVERNGKVLKFSFQLKELL